MTAGVVIVRTGRDRGGRACGPALALAIGGGGIAALGFHSHGLPWMLPVGVACYLGLARTASPRLGAGLGWAFGIGHTLVGFWWLYPCIEGFGGFGQPWPAVIYFLACAEVALFWAGFGLLFSLLAAGRPGWWLAAPSLWVVIEWLRAAWPSWAWNLSGYVWGSWPLAIQVADLGGVHLLSFASVLVAALAVMAFDRRNDRRAALAPLGGILALGLAIGLYGAVRLAEAPLPAARLPAPSGGGEGIRFGMVQPDIAQEIKWRSDHEDEIMAVLESLTRSLAGAADLVVWPESAVPGYLQARPDLMARIARLPAEIGAPLLIGADTAEPDGKGGWRHFNSAQLVRVDGGFGPRYDKHHLIAFGEYLPFRDYLPADLQPMSWSAGDLAAGPGPVPLEWRLPLGVSICFEAIFPDEIGRLAASGARVLVNLTNDAWFGEGIKHQHLTMARMRTVETRLPLVRVANTGISAAFDAWGREIAVIPSGQRAAVVAEVIPGGPPPPSVTLAPWIPVIALAGGLAPLLAGRPGARRRRGA